MLTNSRDKIDKACKILQNMHKQNEFYIPVLQCLAMGRFFQKNSTDAKKMLQNIQNIAYQPEFSDEIEKAWLQLADYEISSNHYQEAEQLLYHCLEYNKSLVKAEEFMGIIKEKEQQYDVAALHYEKAW